MDGYEHDDARRDGIERTAYIVGPYRYRLEQRWARSGGPMAMFAMLNPSTANHLEDDPTIRRCRGFAQREGADAMVIVNLHAWRATQPHDLWVAMFDGEDITGPDNTAHWRIAFANSRPELRIAAWGAWADAPAIARAHRLAGEHGGLRCLGLTKRGHPRHPLYLRSDTPLQDYPTTRSNP